MANNKPNLFNFNTPTESGGSSSEVAQSKSFASTNIFGNLSSTPKTLLDNLPNNVTTSSSGGSIFSGEIGNASAATGNNIFQNKLADSFFGKSETSSLPSSNITNLSAQNPTSSTLFEIFSSNQKTSTNFGINSGALVTSNPNSTFGITSPTSIALTTDSLTSQAQTGPQTLYKQSTAFTTSLNSGLQKTTNQTESALIGSSMNTSNTPSMNISSTAADTNPALTFNKPPQTATSLSLTTKPTTDFDSTSLSKLSQNKNSSDANLESLQASNQSTTTPLTDFKLLNSNQNINEGLTNISSQTTQGLFTNKSLLPSTSSLPGNTSSNANSSQKFDSGLLTSSQSTNKSPFSLLTTMPSQSDGPTKLLTSSPSTSPIFSSSSATVNTLGGSSSGIFNTSLSAKPTFSLPTEGTQFSSYSNFTASKTGTTDLPKSTLNQATSNLENSGVSNSMSKPITDISFAADATSSLIKTQKALIESIHHERIDDLVTNWEKRVKQIVQTFSQYADLVSEIDLNTILQTQKLTDLRKNQEITSSRQKNLAQIIHNIEHQQQNLIPILNLVENELKSKLTTAQDQNFNSKILLNSQQLQWFEQEINQINDIFINLSETNQPDILFSINKAIAMHGNSIETLIQQVEALESSLDKIENKIFR